MIDTNPLLIVDVREQSEYCSEVAVPPGHIAGALSYPWNSGVLEDRYEELPTNADILVVCGIGGRSALASEFLCSRGFTSVYNMTGGMSAWPYATVVCIDTDGDTINDDLDHCTDTDNDGYGNPEFPANTCPRDNCPNQANPDQADADGDCIGNVCDPEPEVYDPLTLDSYPPGGNNCGDYCDCEANFDGDTDVDGSDAQQIKSDFGRGMGGRDPCTNALPCNGDFNCDNDVDGSDVSLFKEDFGRGIGGRNVCPVSGSVPWCEYQ